MLKSPTICHAVNAEIMVYIKTNLQFWSAGDRANFRRRASKSSLRRRRRRRRRERRRQRDRELAARRAAPLPRGGGRPRPPPPRCCRHPPRRPFLTSPVNLQSAMLLLSRAERRSIITIQCRSMKTTRMVRHPAALLLLSLGQLLSLGRLLSLRLPPRWRPGRSGAGLNCVLCTAIKALQC